MREGALGAARNGDADPVIGDLRVVVVSPRWGDGERLFETVSPLTVLLPEAAREASLMPDIYVVDVRDAALAPLVERLANGGVQPVVVVGGATGIASVEYLDAGAADYVPLGTPPTELAARLRAVARRVGGRPRFDDEVRAGDVTVSVERHEVRRAGSVVPLTPHEFQLLETLVSTPDETVPHHKLMVRVWGVENATSRHYLRIYIRQLRKKLEVDPEAPTVILTEWGRGYRFNTTPSRG